MCSPFLLCYYFKGAESKSVGGGGVQKRFSTITIGTFKGTLLSKNPEVIFSSALLRFELRLQGAFEGPSPRLLERGQGGSN